MRVATLVPVIVFAVMLTRARAEEAGTKRPRLLPWFAVAFAVLVAINSTGWVPDVVAKRAAFWRTIRRVAPSRLVFLDESGLNTSMTRSHAWVKKGCELIERFTTMIERA